MGDGRGRQRVLLDILYVEEILSEFFLGHEVWRFAVMLGELALCSDVGFLSALRNASELKRLDHSLLQVGHSYTSKLDLSLW